LDGEFSSEDCLIKMLFIFMLSFTSFETKADELNLHFMRSPLGINWANPWQMTMSTFENSIVHFKKKRAFSISHVFVELKCDSTGEHLYRAMTSADNSNERELVLKLGYGMGVMFQNYPGELEKNATITRDLAPYEKSHRHNILTLKVSASSCKRMITYVNDYDARGFGSKYSGLQADPLKGEGAGCAAFGVSFMRVAGLMDSFTDEWKEIIDVPKRFIGGPLTGNRVSVAKLLTHPFAQWSSRKPHIHLEAWNPERMHSWVARMHRKVRFGFYDGKWPASISEKGRSLQLTLDMSERPTPTENYWQF
jgi:hypothetical protein